tara:strand:- start:814 stop:1095 length:282 start_codon:yes stop_codon:yes gene_type:complete
MSLILEKNSKKESVVFKDSVYTFDEITVGDNFSLDNGNVTIFDKNGGKYITEIIEKDVEKVLKETKSIIYKIMLRTGNGMEYTKNILLKNNLK